PRGRRDPAPRMGAAGTAALFDRLGDRHQRDDIGVLAPERSVVAHIEVSRTVAQQLDHLGQERTVLDLLIRLAGDEAAETRAPAVPGRLLELLQLFEEQIAVG